MFTYVIQDYSKVKYIMVQSFQYKGTYRLKSSKIHCVLLLPHSWSSCDWSLKRIYLGPGSIRKRRAINRKHRWRRKAKKKIILVSGDLLLSLHYKYTYTQFSSHSMLRHKQNIYQKSFAIKTGSELKPYVRPCQVKTCEYYLLQYLLPMFEFCLCLNMHL